MPENLDSYSRSVTVTPDNELYMSCDIVTRKGWEVARRQKNFYQYNHLLNTWQPRCEMITPRVRCGLVYLKGYIYAIAGDDTKRTAERYDPSCDKWTSIPPIPRPVSSKFCAVTLNDSIYVITNKGCCSFSTTKNKWKRRASMLHKPLRPQAVTYQGRIYCIDGDENSQCCPSVEMYNPTTREWKQCGNGSYSFSKATLMVHGETMYLLTILDRDHEDLWDEEEEMGTGVAATYIYKYQPETDSWLNIKERSPRGKLFPPLAEWLSEGSWVDCLTARMIPMCLGDPKDYKGDHDGGEYPMSPSSRISDYSDRDDLSDQENSDLDEDMY
ncbi:kelch repeat and BTB domain-containing protein 8-like isoform X1 [Branchiostoma floridae x Branchiostoma japonicum]